MMKMNVNERPSEKSYTRVIPRDLFNEGSLLNCLGKMWVLLDKRAIGRSVTLEHDGKPFDIDQNENDGSISVRNVEFCVNGKPFGLFRPLNARSHLSLYVYTGTDDIRVFDEEHDDEFSMEFYSWVVVETHGSTANHKKEKNSE
jgi:hypothetical protein